MGRIRIYKVWGFQSSRQGAKICLYPYLSRVIVKPVNGVSGYITDYESFINLLYMDAEHLQALCSSPVILVTFSLQSEVKAPNTCYDDPQHLD